MEENNSMTKGIISKDEIREIGLHDVIVHAVLCLKGVSWEQKMMLAVKELVLANKRIAEKSNKC